MTGVIFNTFLVSKLHIIIDMTADFNSVLFRLLTWGMLHIVNDNPKLNFKISGQGQDDTYGKKIFVFLF